MVKYAEHKITDRLNNGSSIQADRIINCTSVRTGLFLNQLITAAIATPDPLGYAEVVNPNLSLLKLDEQVRNNLWMLGLDTIDSMGNDITVSVISNQVEQLVFQGTRKNLKFMSLRPYKI